MGWGANQQGTEAASGWGPSILPDGGVAGRTRGCILQTSFRGSTPRKIWVGPLPSFMQMRLRRAVLYRRGEQPRPHSGSAAPAAAHAPCGISSQMGGTGDGRPRGVAAPPSAHTVCGAGGGRGRGPATPSTQHRREGVGLLSKGTGAGCVLLCKNTASMPDGSRTPTSRSPSAGFLRDSACSLQALPRRWKPPLGRPATSICPRAAGLVFQGRKHCRRRFPIGSWCRGTSRRSGSKSRSPRCAPHTPRCAPHTRPAPRGQPEYPAVPTALPGRAEGSRTFLTKTPRTRPLRVMPAQGAYGQWDLGWDSGRPSLGAAPWPTSPSVQLLGRGHFPFPAGQGQTAHASRSADGAASIFTAAEPGPSRPPGLAPLCSSARGLAWAGQQGACGEITDPQALAEIAQTRPAHPAGGRYPHGPCPLQHTQLPPSPCKWLPQILTQQSAEMSSFHRTALMPGHSSLGPQAAVRGAPALPCPQQKKDAQDTRDTGSPHHYSPVFSVVSLHLLSEMEPSRMWRLGDVGPPTVGRKTSRDPTSRREVSRIWG